MLRALLKNIMVARHHNLMKYLSEISKQEWAKIIPENYKKLVNGYQSHTETVVAANGRHTTYQTPIINLFFLSFMLLCCWLVTV